MSDAPHPETDFVHLHVHSELTMLEGAIRIPELVDRAAEMGMPAVALTDRANMYGAVQFSRAAKARGIKPILGAELTLAENRMDERKPTQGHIVLLAKDQTGYQNIVRLVSLGWVEGLSHQGVPRIDLELLGQYSEGVIALTACMAGYLPQEILMKGPEAGARALDQLHEIYGDDLFVELEDHGFAENRPLNQVLTELADARGLPLVATNCCHFLERSQAQAQMALQCIGQSVSLREMEAMHHGSSEMYLKSPEQMLELFGDRPDAVRNTMEVFRRCGDVDPLHPPKLPRFPLPEGQTEDDALREFSQRGLQERFAEMRRLGQEPDEQEYLDRLKVELDVIISMGFPGYFLIVQDFINWAKQNGVPVGPGRGSGAGSLVAFALRITNLDPLPYGLLFERFLNPERVSMPDFDVDFCMSRRDKVIDYVRDKYGEHSVGQIATFHLLKSKSVVRDVGRVMGVTPQEAGRLAGLIPEIGPGKSMSIEEALGAEPRFKEAYDNDNEIKELLDTAQQIENLTRHAGMHAAGVVISEGPIWDHVPVFCPEEGVLVTQYHKDDVEAAGLVKFDFLGLKTLTVIDVAVKLIDKRPDRNEPFDIDAIPLDDPATFALLQSGDTTNVFQLESQGMQGLFKALKPDCFEDIVAAVALYRPGPMGADMHTDFVHRKHGRQKVEYPDPCLEPILKDTRGVIVYQEQVMQIARTMGGYSLGGADLLRRAMGKKKASEMEKQKAIFLKGATERGHTAEKAEEVFDLMAYFAGYGFNKSHSAAYALITYQTAYLKAHFPAELCCATMTADKDKSEKVVRTVAEARDLGITVLPPSVNESAIDFTVVYEPVDVKAPPGRPVSEKGELRDPTGPAIRFGLGALKGVGGAALDALFEARTGSSTADEEGGEEQPFVDLFDFCDRVDLRRVNKNVIEALVKSGAFDPLHDPIGVHRAQSLTAIPTALERGKQAAADRASGQTSLFGLLGSEEEQKSFTRAGGTFPENVEPWDSREQLKLEKESLGFYVSGHPLDRYIQELRRFCNATTETLHEMDRGTKLTIGGSVEGYRERRTRTGTTMAFFEIEDPMGRVEVIVRPRQLDEEGLRETLTSGEPIIIEGRVKHEHRDDDVETEPKIILYSVQPLSELLSRKTRAVNVKLDVTVVDRPKLERLRACLTAHPGPVPVSIELLNDPDHWSALLEETGLCVEPSDSLLASLERLFGGKVTELR